jgi:hypothetical protein
MNSLSKTLGLACLLQLHSLTGCADDAADAAAPIIGAAGAEASPPADPEPKPPAAGAEATAADGCSRGTLGDDFQAAPLAGVNVQKGSLIPGDYLISSTYLQLRGESDRQQRFDELMGPIMADLEAREGLVAISLGGSASCGAARTLAVWRDEMAMFGFVTGEAHGQAIASVGEVSRGGSIVTHWSGAAGDATWQSAAEHLAADEGPFY